MSITGNSQERQPDVVCYPLKSRLIDFNTMMRRRSTKLWSNIKRIITFFFQNYFVAFMDGPILVTVQLVLTGFMISLLFA